jgi:hypothetical protein
MLVLLAALLGWPIAGRAQGRVHVLWTNGPAASRLNLVVLSEGYTASEETQFVQNATTFLESFFVVEPFAEYRQYFNAQAIFVASSQQGSDHPLSGVWRNTYFNSSYDSYGAAQIVTIPPNDRDPVYGHGRGRVDALLATVAPQCDLPVLLVNDHEYGGSGGPVLIGSVHSAAVELLLHESGHTLGNLADEYQDPYPGFVPQEAPNSTAHSIRSSIPWAAWIAPETPVPTPPTAEFADALGLFEGAQYQATGWYRPKLNCRMRALGVPFCEVCREQLVKRVYAFSPPAESPTPLATNLVVSDNSPLPFQVTLAQPRTHTLQCQWYLDDVLQSQGSTAQFLLETKSLTNGPHRLAATVRDGTDWVRNDPEARLTMTFGWSLQVARPILRLDTAQMASNNRMQFIVTGEAPRGFVLEWSASLVAWTVLSTNTLAGGQLAFDLPVPPGSTAGFYRAAAR